MVSAYALLDNSYKEYKKKVIEIHGKDGELEIVEAIAEDKYEKEQPEVKTDELLFYDNFSGRFFNSTMNDVLAAFYQINRHVNSNYCATLNDFYNYLDIPTIDGGNILGWSVGMNSEAYWQEWIDFGIEELRPYLSMDGSIIVKYTGEEMDSAGVSWLLPHLMVTGRER